ncbi:hypothetical protein M409DRAFT_65378 [Zasmidium cellare ATCC 36951]|uniref:Uncharacterized protein n=1 Tax=Zasmidium cellare ATCC 36951 TaxID=1080233 RepID=A0A6A6CPN4_ZASCE|nr:uncharacterized protein M409DRAFT_65378 [Zasmidium cellare ATCC 36951]KAF2169094.1 hypothetical protein M409DRAFT_65378 [Zasmidium cellare ATCC 36951]
MGRQQYLTRLALGRSAFEPIEETQQPTQQPQTPEDGRPQQQYDSKGRPTNPRIDAFNAEMRKAQNDVLALVGVVERKDLSDRREEQRGRFVRDTREKVLRDEQEKGELMDYTVAGMGFLGHLWTEALVQRVQVGVYGAERGIGEIVVAEWRGLFSDGGLRRGLAGLFPGLGDIVMHTLVRLPLIVAVEQLTGRIQNYVQKRRFKRRTTKRLYTAISILFELVLLGIDMALLPMEFHARAQKLGLAPLLPLFPSWKCFLPWHAASFHQFGWKPLFGVIFVRSLTTPGVLLLLYKVFHWDADESEIPIAALFSTFRYPPIDTDPSLIPTPTDPIGWLTHNMWSLRSKFMEWCGWDMHQLTSRPGHHGEEILENNTRQRDGTLHRSTALAHLPAQRLAGSIDSFLARCITLPFESLMLRSVAHAFLSYTPTPAAIEAAPHIYAPFTGGPISQVLRSPTDRLAWSSAGVYASRLGLALALDVSVDVLLFFGVYASTRYVGRRWYDWRPRRRAKDDEGVGERREIGD